MLRLLLLTVTIFTVTTCATLPGFRFQVTQKGVDYAKDILLPILHEKILEVGIPDISQRLDTPVGHITAELKNIKVHSVAFENTKISLKEPSDVIAYIYNAMISFTSDWHYKEESWPHISDSGTADIGASQISININILIDVTTDGLPHVLSKSCDFNVGDLSINFVGGDAWFYNLFSSFLEDVLKESIKDQVCPILTDTINDSLNLEIATLTLKTDIDNNAFIDYSLVDSPFVLSNAIFVDGKGEIYNKADPEECPSPKNPLPSTVPSDHMVSMWITEYMLNSAGYAYQQAGFLQYNLTQSDIPSNVPIKLTTEFFKYFVPALHKAYPDKDLIIWIQVGKPVTFKIAKSGVSAMASGTLSWLVETGDNQYTEAFTLNAELKMCVNVSLELGTNSMVFVKIITLEPAISLQSSNIGNFTTSSLQAFLTLSNSLIVPLLNGFLTGGLPLPSFDNILFEGFDFNLQEGYLEVHTDVRYIPTSLFSPPSTLHTVADYTCSAMYSDETEPLDF